MWKMGMEWGRRVSSRLDRPKKFASRAISGVIGRIISVIYKCML